MGRPKLTGSTGERLLQVLDALVRAGQPVALPELAESTQLPRPTVQRLLKLMEETGYAIKDLDGRRHVPGPALRALSLALLQHRPAAAVRHAILKQLAETVGEACNIVLLDGAELTYIDRVDTAWPLRLRFEIGSHVPIYCTATGKLLLALQPKRVRDRIIAATPLHAFTAQSITDPDELQTALKRIRRERIGVDDQEFIAEMVAIAVPVDAPAGPPVAAVSIHGPILRCSVDSLRVFIPALNETAQALSATLYDSDTAGGAVTGAGNRPTTPRPVQSNSRRRNSKK